MARIMIVDDAKVMRINLGNMLKRLGHVVVAEADSGSDAVLLYKQHKPDIVTMDITMPEEIGLDAVQLYKHDKADDTLGDTTSGISGIKDGIDAVKRIKLEFPDAKIIMVTSHGEQDKVIKAIQSGASNYLLKPIDIKKLEEVINKLL